MVMPNKTLRPRDDKYLLNGFVNDGYERVIHGIEAEVRTTIEQYCADECNAHTH